MNTVRVSAVLSAALLSLGLGGSAQAQQADMTFFITSAGPGKGGNLGGLEGADRHCQQLAQAAGVGNKTWKAYLSSATNAAASLRIFPSQGYGARRTLSPPCLAVKWQWFP